MTGACERKEGLLAPVVITITVTPNPQSLLVNGTQQFTAVGRDASGATIAITPVWSVVAGGGTINASTGMFTAGTATGTFTNTIRATSGDVSGFATVTVTAAPLATITVTPNPATMATGGAQQFTAVGRDAGGNVVAITPVWTVVNGGGAINGSTGAFTAGNVAGTFANTVRATSGSISGTATVIVTAGPAATLVVTPNPVTLEAGTTQQFTAVARDAAGNIVTVTPVWSVVNGGGAIGSGTGMFTAGNVAGTFANTVRATVGALSATATVNVTVTPPPVGALASITVTPNPATLETHASAQFTAVGRDANGNIVAFVPTWSVVNGGGAIGANSGQFAAGANAGTFSNTIRAASGGIEGFATVIVTPSTALARIIVSPNPATVGVGANQQFIAVGQDISGNPVAITPVWSVVNGGGTINAASGMFTAGLIAATYANTVRATSGTLSGDATVIVTPGPLATITVTPNPATMGTGASTPFTATGRDANGNVVSITPVWTVVNGGGTINAASGMFTAGNNGGTFTNTVRATSGAISGNATVNVTPGPLATITVAPNPGIMGTGESTRFSAIGRDANGNVVFITPSWSVVNGGGTINATSGMFTAGGLAGTFNNTVRATAGGLFGSATAEVTAAPAPAPLIPLGNAAPNGIMAGTAVTCVTLGIVNADVSISPGNTITGFGPCVITGVQHLGDAVAANAQLDLTTAYNTAMGLPCPPANAIVADLGGTVKAAGVYCSATSIGVTGVLTLDGGGDPNATFVFQAGSSLTTAGDIVLINGAQAKNVYWVIGSSATIGTASQWQGNIMALTSITLVDNANLIGRALARNGAVTLGTNNVITLP